MSNIIVHLSNGKKEKYGEATRFDKTTIEYHGHFAVLKLEYGKEVVFPDVKIEKIEINKGD